MRNVENLFYYIILTSVILLISSNFIISYLFINPVHNGLEAWIDDVEYNEDPQFIESFSFSIQSNYEREVPVTYYIFSEGNNWMLDSITLKSQETKTISLELDYDFSDLDIIVTNGEHKLFLKIK